MNLWKKLAFIGCASFLVLATVCRSDADTLNVSADTTWRAIGPLGELNGPPGINGVGGAWEAAHPGWNNSTAFDDSDAAGWTNVVAVTHPNPPITRYWVDGTDTVGASPAYFRKEFFLGGTPTAGSFYFGVDDDAQLYLNGTKLIDDSNGLATDFFGINALPHLVPGLNLIAIKAYDQQGAQAYLFDMNITFTPGPVVDPPGVPEPSTIAMASLGLAGLGLLAWRRRRRSR